jgi:hypothetical protein
MTVYHASPIKRRRATATEMEARAEFLIDYATRHGPVTVRQLFYAATVADVPGIDKTEAGYCKVQTQVLALRRAGRLDYDNIADSTRWMRRPDTFEGLEDALRQTARFYRKSLWTGSAVEVEIWLEKNALAGVVYPIADEFDVPLMVTSGYTSETFCYQAVERLRGDGKTLVIYSLYDFDRSGKDAEASLREKVERFGAEFDVPVEFHPLALTAGQIGALNLPTRPPKAGTAADRRWPHAFAAELDAIPPDTLREMVRWAIERHLPADELERLKRIEAAERHTLMQFVEGAMG